jgi:hypothetical protein
LGHPRRYVRLITIHLVSYQLVQDIVSSPIHFRLEGGECEEQGEDGGDVGFGPKVQGFT